MLKVFQFHLQKEDYWLCWFALPELKQCLQEQEQSLDLKKRLNVVHLLEYLIQVAKALPVCLSLKAHRGAIVEQYRVEIDASFEGGD